MGWYIYIYYQLSNVEIVGLKTFFRFLPLLQNDKNISNMIFIVIMHTLYQSI